MAVWALGEIMVIYSKNKGGGKTVGGRVGRGDNVPKVEILPSLL